jgi:hypothetical protein
VLCLFVSTVERIALSPIDAWGWFTACRLMCVGLLQIEVWWKDHTSRKPTTEPLKITTINTTAFSQKKKTNMANHMAQDIPKPTTVWGLLAFVQVSPTQKVVVAIPVSKISPTHGLAYAMSRTLSEPATVCLAPICPSGDGCKDLHVDTEYLRRAVSNLAPCCAYCDDVFSRQVLQDCPSLQFLLGPFVTGNGMAFPIERTSLTTAIPRQHSWGEIRIPSTMVCPDHLRGCCPRGKDCSWFHLCRSRWIALREIARGE